VALGAGATEATLAAEADVATGTELSVVGEAAGVLRDSASCRSHAIEPNDHNTPKVSQSRGVIRGTIP
jgi:hypothetical protein